MNGKTKIAVAYCVICTVLFITVFTVLSSSIKMPGAAAALIASMLYCAAVAAGLVLILKVFSGNGISSEPPVKGSKSILRLLAIMQTPVVMTNSDGKISWFNTAFDEASQQSAKKDQLITQFCNISVRSLLSDENADGVICRLFGRDYRVYGYRQSSSGEGLITTLWFDVSETEKLRGDMEKSRVIVANVIVDMANNFLSGLQDRYAEASAGVTKYLKGWAESCEGFITEYENGKFIMLFRADKLQEMKRSSFPVLSEVKKITFGEDSIPMTVSIGIADSHAVLSERYKIAKQAVQFALQRGGDQVVVKTDAGKDEFYGGASKHDPQLTSLNARRLIAQARPFIEKAGSVIIMGHKNADFDCLAACMGIAKICLMMKKKTTIVVKRNKNIEKPYDMLKEMPAYGELFYDFDRDSFDMVEHDSLLFIVDVNNPVIFEYPKLTEQVSQIIMIDHHRRASSELSFDPQITYIEPSASSASEIVSQMLEQILPSGVLIPFEANLLLAGIQLDTHNFTRDCGAGTYAAAQYLRREGADSAVASAFFTLDPDDFIKELKIESTMRKVRDGYYICTGSDSMPISESAAAARVAETIMKVEGVRASFAVCRLKTPNGPDPMYTISARSDGTVNVQIILEELGGGGHHSNAGAQLSEGKTIPFTGEALADLTIKSVVSLLESAINKKASKTEQQ